MEITRLFNVLDYQLEKKPLDKCLVAKIGGSWKALSTSEVKHQVDQLSTGLLHAGLKPQDKIGIISFNRPEWVLADFAISQLGCISVPMYPNSTADDYKFIINDAGVKAIFCGDQEIYDKVKLAIAGHEQSVKIYTFDKVEGAAHWETVLSSSIATKEIDDIRATINYEDLATIIYTSGTTGNPKGVMLSHKNILSNSKSVEEIFPAVEPGFKTLSFLPLCHIFERTGLYTYMRLGVSIYYAESMDAIGENLKEVKPHFFATVPRLLEKVYDKIIAKGMELTGVKRSLFFWAIDLGNKYEPFTDMGWWYNMQLGIANKLVFSKWREALGGNLRFVVSGAAALQPRLARVFWAAQIKILEAYGLTETSPGISFSTETDVRIGCVGPLLPEVEVKFADDGEILAKGPNVMMGYYNRPEATAAVMDGEWFHTGDIGVMEGKFLKITDRKKEIFKTSGGKYIAPQILENKFKESIMIEQIMVVGEGEKFPAALVVPSFEALRKWCEVKHIAYTTDQEMLSHPDVLDKLDRERVKYNEQFAQYEQIKKFKLLSSEWSVDSGELTPTMKLKRKQILSKYADEVAEIYGG